MTPDQIHGWESILQSPVAVSLLLLGGLAYVEWRSRTREDKHERERDAWAAERKTWMESLRDLTIALEAVRDRLRDGR